MDAIYYHPGVNGRDGVFVIAAMNHSVRSRPGGGEFVATASGSVMVKEDQVP